jgi:hypothetical protein
LRRQPSAFMRKARRRRLTRSYLPEKPHRSCTTSSSKVPMCTDAYGSIDALQQFACETPSTIDYGLNVEHVGDHAVILIKNALNPLHEGTPCWSKVDFIACCILLRGCAKSLIVVLPTELRDSTVVNWNEGFTAFLHSDEGTKNLDDDFVVKIHATVRCNATGSTQLSLMCIPESPRKPEQWSSRRR